MTNEHGIMKRVMLALSEAGHTLFRNNTAQGWAGKAVVRREADGSMTVTIRDARPLYAGLCKGGGDLIGWSRSGRFMSVEVKTPTGRPTPEQTAFANAVTKNGGIGIVTSSPEQALEMVTLAERVHGRAG